MTISQNCFEGVEDTQIKSIVDDYTVQEKI